VGGGTEWVDCLKQWETHTEDAGWNEVGVENIEERNGWKIGIERYK